MNLKNEMVFSFEEACGTSFKTLIWMCLFLFFINLVLFTRFFFSVVSITAFRIWYLPSSFPFSWIIVSVAAAKRRYCEWKCSFLRQHRILFLCCWYCLVVSVRKGPYSMVNMDGEDRILRLVLLTPTRPTIISILLPSHSRGMLILSSYTTGIMFFFLSPEGAGSCVFFFFERMVYFDYVSSYLFKVWMTFTRICIEPVIV